jgi:hypothetical protein
MDSETPHERHIQEVRVSWLHGRNFLHLRHLKGQIYKNDLPPKVLMAGAFEDRNSQVTSENG